MCDRHAGIVPGLGLHFSTVNAVGLSKWLEKTSQLPQPEIELNFGKKRRSRQHRAAGNTNRFSSHSEVS